MVTTYWEGFIEAISAGRHLERIHYSATDLLSRSSWCKSYVPGNPWFGNSSRCQGMVTSVGTCDAILNSSTWDGGLGITRLSGLIPSVQTHRLQWIARSSDDAVKSVVWQEGIQKECGKLWIAADGDKEKIPSIWDSRAVMVISEVMGGEEPFSKSNLSETPWLAKAGIFELDQVAIPGPWDYQLWKG